MRVAVKDVARVVHAAHAGGRHVVLGGHSLGGWIATAYATWDFGGRAGARDLDGLVLIDGASGAAAITPADARQTLAKIEHGSPFLALRRRAAAVDRRRAQRRRLDAGRARARRAVAAAGMAAVARRGQAAGARPTHFDRRILRRRRRQPPRASRRAGPTSAPGRVRRPARLQDGRYATTARAARAISGVAGADGIAWFHPRRLTLDAKAVEGGVANRAQALLGLRATRGADDHMPIYAIETSFLKGARS